MKKLYLNEEGRRGKFVHVYTDRNTGDEYIFNGEKLIKIGSYSPQVGDKGDEKEAEKEDRQRGEEIAKERAEQGENEKNREETPEEKEARFQRIQDMLNSGEVKGKIESETKRKANTSSKFAKQARDLEKYKSPIRQFKMSLERFVKDQVRRVRKKSWDRPDMRYEDSGLLKPGRAMKNSTNRPIIHVYFDQSGSWQEQDVAVGKEAIGVLRNYEQRQEIEIKLWYFANTLCDKASDARKQGGTAAGPELLEHIQSTRPNNVIIMTDSDFDHTLDASPKVTVDGAVWFLFRRHESKDLIKHLRGRAQTQKFMI